MSLFFFFLSFFSTKKFTYFGVNLNMFAYFRNCGKVYHPECVGKDDAFFDNVKSWNCGKFVGFIY